MHINSHDIFGSWITLICAQGSLVAGPWGSYGMPGIKAKSTFCKANAVPPLRSLK